MKYIGYLLLAFLVYFAIFWNLDFMPIRLWDESRLAINALEMYENRNYFVTYFNGLPDMWNTKPPLLIWAQVLMFKMFGVSVMSLRLPSAFAALFTVIVIMVFSLKYIKSFWFGFIASLILISIDGYIELHSVRTGDYDFSLVLFTTLSGLLFFVYSESRNNKYLLLFFVSLMVSVLIKGIAGLLFVPGLFFYSLLKGQVFEILKNKNFHIGILILSIPVVSIYLIREFYNTGYIEAVFNNEVGGRYFTKKNINNDYLYYLKMLTRRRMVPWYILVPISLGYGVLHNDRKIRNLSTFLMTMIFPFLIIISFSKTKLIWYDLPTFPFIAILITILIYDIFKRIQKRNLVKSKWVNMSLPLIFVLSLITIPYLKIINKNRTPQEYVFEKRAFDLGRYLQDATKGIHDLNGYTTVYSGYRPQIDFYHRILNRNGINIKFQDWDKLKQGDKVLVVQEDDKNKIEMKYSFIKLYSKGDFTIYSIE